MGPIFPRGRRAVIGREEITGDSLSSRGRRPLTWPLGPRDRSAGLWAPLSGVDMGLLSADNGPP